MSNYVKLTLALLAGLLTLAINNRARADHQYDYILLEAKAEEVRHSMNDVHRSLAYSYSRSRLFGQIMSTSSQIRSRASYIRSAARHHRSIDWHAELHRLDGLVYQLKDLVNQANYRAELGLDHPIRGCPIAVGREITAVYELVECMKEVVYGQRGRIGRGRGYSHSAGHHGSYAHHGSYGQHGSSVQRGSSGHHGSYGHHGSRYQSHGSSHYRGSSHRAARPVQLDRGGVTIDNGRVSFRIKF